jgi:hypothetical protein
MQDNLLTAIHKKGHALATTLKPPVESHAATLATGVLPMSQRQRYSEHHCYSARDESIDVRVMSSTTSALKQPSAVIDCSSSRCW